MKIECINGYYKFYPTTAMQITLIETLYGVSMAKIEDFFTFEELTAIKGYSIKNTAGNSFKFNATFAGLPQDVLKANKLALNLSELKITSIETITEKAVFVYDRLRIASRGLLQAYAILDGKRIEGFSAYYDFNKSFYEYDRLVLI
ncbi:MAG: hypothetical protein LBU09_01005 [Endomicrobium sp.]|jgi:hypothetical protein|nr:hypothetical protein [Endomicrobium sp.]